MSVEYSGTGAVCGACEEGPESICSAMETRGGSGYARMVVINIKKKMAA